ncbi:MAG: glycoside hydrolase family 16 protein [Ilyomonas sp.]
MNRLFVVFLTLPISLCLNAQEKDAYQPDFYSPPPSVSGYKLVWNDEFNKDGKPDSAKWIFENGFVRNEELQWYQPQNANCSKGVLLIEGRKEKIENPNYQQGSNNWRLNRQYADYSSASLQTRGLQEWKYGRFEIRARIDTAQGAWPAIWTLGIERSWPSNGEVDIMEFYRIKSVPTILANLAWGTDTLFVAKWHTETTPLIHFTAKDKDWANKFHIWRMDWNEDSIKLYLDDELLNSTSLNKTLNADGSNPFHQPHYLLLNLALGQNGGDPSVTKHPIKFEVDYVRVYQKVRLE